MGVYFGIRAIYIFKFISEVPSLSKYFTQILNIEQVDEEISGRPESRYNKSIINHFEYPDGKFVPQLCNLSSHRREYTFFDININAHHHHM